MFLSEMFCRCSTTVSVYVSINYLLPKPPDSPPFSLHCLAVSVSYQPARSADTHYINVQYIYFLPILTGFFSGPHAAG